VLTAILLGRAIDRARAFKRGRPGRGDRLTYADVIDVPGRRFETM
jgi:hypothetical protein